MQIEINKIADWLIVNKLSINIKKTKFILFKSPKKRLNHSVTISISNKPIDQVKSISFLGVNIDEHLTWKNHIDSVSKKISKTAGIIARVRHYANLNTLKLVYYALVYPYLIYANVVWGNTYTKRIQKLLSKQKKIVRLMSFKSNFDHTDPIFQDLKILTLPKINDYLTLLFMYRYHKTEHLSIIFNNLFVNNSDIHHYKTRNASNLHKKYRRTNYVNHSLASKGVDIWNKLDSHLKSINSLIVFKSKLKKYLFVTDSCIYSKYNHSPI
jgi:hypothetical protein